VQYVIMTGVLPMVCRWYLDLVVITDELDRVGPGLVVDDDADDQPPGVNGIGRGSSEYLIFGLVKHFIGFETEVEKVEYDDVKNGDDGEGNFRSG
jgi:hypothetical protein